MDTGTMRCFLTDSSIKLHTDYLRRLKLEHSINEKSFPELRGKSVCEISRMNLPREDKRKIIDKLKRIKAHECYFASFGPAYTVCKPLRKWFSSEEGFLYELCELALSAESGFLYVYVSERGRPTFALSSPTDDFFIRREPILAIDLCEHAYFSDYGFEYKKYLKNSLCYLDLTRLLPSIGA